MTASLNRLVTASLNRPFVHTRSGTWSPVQWHRTLYPAIKRPDAESLYPLPSTMRGAVPQFSNVNCARELYHFLLYLNTIYVYEICLFMFFFRFLKRFPMRMSRNDITVSTGATKCIGPTIIELIWYIERYYCF